LVGDKVQALLRNEEEEEEEGGDISSWHQHTVKVYSTIQKALADKVSDLFYL